MPWNDGNTHQCPRWHMIGNIKYQQASQNVALSSTLALLKAQVGINGAHYTSVQHRQPFTFQCHHLITVVHVPS